MIARFFSVFFLILALAAPALSAPEAPAPRVAFWDPVAGASDEAVNLKADASARVAAWMRASGAVVTMLRIDEIADPQTFSSQKFDILVTPGEAFPAFLQTSVADFASTGGVLMALSAREAPWSMPLVPDVNGLWRLQPGAKSEAPTPLDLGAHFTDFGDAHGTFFHRATPFLSKYLVKKDQNELLSTDTPIFEGFLPAPHIEFEKGTQITPLVRSFDGGKVPLEGTPQVFLAQRGPFKALVVLSEVWASDDPESWHDGAALFGALSQIGHDFAGSKLAAAP